MKLTYEESRCTVCKKAYCTNLLIDLKAEDYGVICIECAIQIYVAVKHIKRAGNEILNVGVAYEGN